MNELDNLRDLKAFLMVCEAGNFTKAAARIGVTQSALSQTIRALEARLGLRLFDRTTRSVAPTDAGQRLRKLAGPALQSIEEGLEGLSAMRHSPSGSIRLTADEFAVEYVLLPALERFLPQYPDIQVEVSSDHQLTDIISGNFDAGVRRGGLVAKDMIAMQIGPATQMAVVGSTSYFETHPVPVHPKDLTAHRCINLRLPTHGEIFPWRFRKGSHEQRIRTTGPLVFNSLTPILRAAKAGLGLAWLPMELVQADIDAGELLPALDSWRHTFEPHFLYYPDRRHTSTAFSLLREALRYKA